ncbi:MAG: ribonuclease R [Candidatus Polarisedimenticolaceae bacterium]|nr:ribonuclease R [Candidatus Polarisedimenticolaceae bacterium]
MAKAPSKESKREQDPYRSREQKKYENPIPSREFIMDLLEALGEPLTFEPLAEKLSLSDEQDIIALQRRLGAMERDGQLLRNRRSAFCLVKKSDLITGRVIGHKDGFGFLKPDEAGEDLFLSPRQMRSLFHGDRAIMQVTGIDRRGRREGGLVEVLEHNTKTVVGRINCGSGIGFVVADNKRIVHEVVVAEADYGDAKDGQIVVVEITQQPSKRNKPVGRVIEVVGEHMGPGMQTDVAIITHAIPDAWPEAVEQEIAGLSAEVDEAAKEGRVDLRKLPLVTIDGEDARDFDDAVFCKRTEKGWKLLVSIADVSAYVKPGSALDREAHKRGNSVYFPDRVVPMLPEILSNGLCSLNPDVDRLCMTCELYFDREGKVTRSRFFEGVMRSQARLTYNKVAEMLDDPTLVPAEQTDLLPHLQELHNLFQVLFAARQKRGAIEFDTPETKIVFGEDKRVDRIVPVYRNDAHRLIEECMLSANVATARMLLRKKQPALYRIHETPVEAKLADLRDFLGELGLSLGGGDEPTASDYGQLLVVAKERQDAHLIQTVLLRSMAQAVYSAANCGHFGLAYDAYTHFTSPIRRYPDLVVHRAIKHTLLKGKADDFHYSPIELQSMGEHCSSTERRADEATRDAMDWLKCEYMQDKVGETFDGLIVSVNSFGLFVQLNEIYIDGLIHITALDNDYYHFDPVGHRLTGERSGQVYRLGDALSVQVAAVNLDDRKIDFLLAGTPLEKPNVKKPKKRKAKDKPKAAEERVEPAEVSEPVTPEPVVAAEEVATQKPLSPWSMAKAKIARKKPAPDDEVTTASTPPLEGEEDPAKTEGESRAPKPKREKKRWSSKKKREAKNKRAAAKKEAKKESKKTKNRG